jgi:PBSX family phage portal protein
MAKMMSAKTIKVNKAETEVQKALFSTNIEYKREQSTSGIDGILYPQYSAKDLQLMVQESTILQQCIEAYQTNIVGFGPIPCYKDDDVAGKEETPEMKAEWDYLKNFFKNFNYDMPFEGVWKELIQDREETGNAYLECIRDLSGAIVSGERLAPENMYVCAQGKFVEYKVFIDGQEVIRRKRFRKYVQDIDGTKVFYKEVGDPRIMDMRNGEYVDALEEEFQANEVLHLKLGNKEYGVPRWIGQVVHMAGARLAEELNYRYFTQGRHTPMAILLHNAQLSPESEQALIDYATSVEGVEHSHKFLIIEATGEESGLLGEETKNARVELKSLAELLQEDALFLEYDDASREKIQSAFRLPDIYVGRSKDFNRATADTARYITEEQVFEPQRTELEWIINNKILITHPLTHVKASFKKPEVSNSEELALILEKAISAGAVAPNDIRSVLGEFLGKELENFEDPMFDLPLQVGMMLKNQEFTSQQQDKQMAANKEQADQAKKEKEEEEKKKQVEKAYAGEAPILKEIRDLLEKQYSRA